MNIKGWNNNIYNKLVFAIEVILSLVLGITIYKMSYIKNDFDYVHRNYLIINMIALIFILAILIFNIIKYKKQVEKLFLTFMIPIGIMFVVLFPVGFAPDEDSHMYKAYDLSCGNFITPLGEDNKGDIYVPQKMVEIIESISKKDKNIYSVTHEYMQKETDYNQTVPVQTIAKTYSIVNYLTSGLTFFIARAFNINILLAAYIAKLVNFIMFIIVGYYCIKVIPFGKLLLSIYMFIPMIIQQACSLSADAIINCLAILFITYNLKLLYQEKDISVKQRIIYNLIAISLSLCKYVYFPLVFMSLLLIRNKNISKKNRNTLIIVSIFTSILATALWYLFSQKYIDVREYIKINEIKPFEQLAFILKNPFNYIQIIWDTFEKNGEFYLLTFVGSELGCLDINIPKINILIMLLGLVLLPFLEKNNLSFERKQKVLIILIFVILILLIMTGLYMTWTSVGGEIINGVQGRYFIPVFILILLSMIKKGENIKMKNIELKYFIIYFVINIISLFVIYENII